MQPEGESTAISFPPAVRLAPELTRSVFGSLTGGS